MTTAMEHMIENDIRHRPHPRPEVEAALRKYGKKRRNLWKRDPELQSARDWVAASDRARAVVAADPFFGPLLAIHARVFDRTQIYGPEETPESVEEDVVMSHVNALKSIARGEIYYRFETVTRILELDLDMGAFIRRIAEYYAINPAERRCNEVQLAETWDEAKQDYVGFMDMFCQVRHECPIVD